MTTTPNEGHASEVREFVHDLFGEAVEPTEDEAGLARSLFSHEND